MADFDDASQAFIAWLRQLGAEISPKICLADLRNREAGRGVIAMNNIAEHELLFRIPRSAILSVENSILATEVPAATFEMLGPWLSLILVMLYEHLNGEASNWAAYFDILPTRFDTLMFWSDDELAELQASAVVQKIGKESAEAMFMEQLLPVIREFADTFFAGEERARQKAEEMRDERDVALMHRMGTLIMAYAFDVEPATPKDDVDDEGFAEQVEEEALPKGMVPLADMLNADADRCNARLFYEKDYLEMKALKPITAGEEILNDYGSLPRSDLLRRYGYVTDNYKQYDVVEIPMDLVAEVITAEGGWSEQRLDYLDERDVVDNGYDIATSTPYSLQESLSPELIILVETLLLSQEEFDTLKRKSKLPRPERITSRGALVLHKLIEARIAKYTTSLEQDLQSTSSVSNGINSTKQHRYKMAKAVRIGEKFLLKQTHEALAEIIARDTSTTKRQRAVDEEGDVEMSGTGKKQRA
ncbi:Ribosomal lysine N-methyltransferase 4 [Coniothyrium glycines]